MFLTALFIGCYKLMLNWLDLTVKTLWKVLTVGDVIKSWFWFRKKKKKKCPQIDLIIYPKFIFGSMLPTSQELNQYMFIFLSEKNIKFSSLVAQRKPTWRNSWSLAQKKRQEESGKAPKASYMYYFCSCHAESEVCNIISNHGSSVNIPIYSQLSNLCLCLT